MAFVNISTSCWPRRVCFRSRRRTAFIPRRLDLVLLFPNCTLLRAARIEHHGHFAGAPPSVCFSTGGLQSSLQAPPLGVGLAFSPYVHSLMGGPGSRPCGAIHCLQGSFQLHRRNCHTEPLLLRRYPSCKGLDAIAPRGAEVALPHHPVAAGGAFKSTDASWPCMTSNPITNSSVILATNTQVVNGRSPIVSFTKASFSVGRSPLMPSTGPTELAARPWAVHR